MRRYTDKLMDDYTAEGGQFYVFSRDFMRVDVGLIIQRPPIFLKTTEKDMAFLKLKTDVMDEYWWNQKQYSDEYREVSKLNADILAESPYTSQMNLDNFPTHQYTEPETGKMLEYSASTKYFRSVDPAMPDKRSLHYAGEDRIYLITKNRYTQEWEFPVGKMFIGHTFLRAK